MSEDLNKQRHIEQLNAIEALLGIDMPSKLADRDLRKVMAKLADLNATTLNLFRTDLSHSLVKRSETGRGHLNEQEIHDLVFQTKFQSWLCQNGLSEKAAKTVQRGLKFKNSSDMNLVIKNETYTRFTGRSLVDLVSEGSDPEDARKFVEIVETVGLPKAEAVEIAFRVNFKSDCYLREESLRSRMRLRDLVSVYLFSFLQVMFGEADIPDLIITKISRRLEQSNNIDRQFSVSLRLVELRNKGILNADQDSKAFVHQINRLEIENCIDQFSSRKKLKSSKLEPTKLLDNINQALNKIADSNQETVSIISMSYRLDNPSEPPHTAEELFLVFEHSLALTRVLDTISISKRDIFNFFEIVGECDHKNIYFSRTIESFDDEIHRTADQKDSTGDRVELKDLVLAYIASRLDVFLRDEMEAFAKDEEAAPQKTIIISSLTQRLRQCRDPHRQFAILDRIEHYISQNFGLLQQYGNDESYWSELVNSLELSIILDIYIDNKYLIPDEDPRMKKNQIIDSIQKKLNSIDNIIVKSLTTVFFTAHLTAHLEEASDKTKKLSEFKELINGLQRDAELASSQIHEQERVKKELLSSIMERLYRLETIQKILETSANLDLLSRIDEVVLGLRTRRDNLIEGKMDPIVLEKDINSYLNDEKVIVLLDRAEKSYKEHVSGTKDYRSA